jgi:5-methylcytosine-specific restriction endonuclease McrA
MWQADHIVALHTIPPSQLEDYPACLRFWCADNLQTLCYDHHTKKTAQEATVRAKVKRIRARIEGTRRERKKVPTRQPYRDNTRYIDKDAEQINI